MNLYWRQHRSNRQLESDTESEFDDCDETKDSEDDDTRLEKSHGEEDESSTIDNADQVNETDEELLKTLTVPQLKDRLRERGLTLGGRKADLIQRLLLGQQQKSTVKGWKDSAARAFLSKLFHDEKSNIHRMSPEQIYNSNKMFQNYPLDKFKIYLETIQSSAKKFNEIVAVNERNIWSDLHAFPRGETTLGNYPHWDNHPACALLKKDIENGHKR